MNIILTNQSIKSSQMKSSEHCPNSEHLCLGLAVELELLLVCLEATVTEFGGSGDEFQFDLLHSVAVGLRDQGATESDATLLGTDDATLDHQVIILDNTIVCEATHGGDLLLGLIE